VQVDFYISPRYDLMAIKWDAFQVMGSKLKSWRHSLKNSLKIQPGDTSSIVKARMGQNFINNYDPFNLEMLLDK
jgi:hypothetical protein